MDFRQANEEFKRLKARFETGELTEAEFKERLRDLMVQDEGGAWWMIGYETERWYRHDGTSWVQADPPVSPPQEAVPVPPLQAEAKESKRTEPAPPASALRKAPEAPARRPIIPIALAGAVILVVGGYFILSSMSPGPRPAATPTAATDIAIAEKPTTQASQTPKPAIPPSEAAIPTLPASRTPEPSPTSEPELHVQISSSQARLYEGPGLQYSDIKTYPRGEDFTVIARNPYGDWLLVRAADGNEGWLYYAWVDRDFDVLTVPTATYIPPPPVPTQKPKDSNKPTPCIFC